MINGMILILIMLIFRSLMAMSLDAPLMVQLIRFARASSHVTDFNNRNKFLTAKLLKQGYRYHKLRKAFSKFYRRHFGLIENYHVNLKTNLCNKVFIFQNSMEIWYINLRKSLEIQTSLIFSNVLETVSREQCILKTLCGRLHA